jgi:hypothetical protein
MRIWYFFETEILIDWTVKNFFFKLSFPDPVVISCFLFQCTDSRSFAKLNVPVENIF